MNDLLTEEDRKAGCLSGLMIAIGFGALVLSLSSHNRWGIGYNIALFVGMAAPIIFPLISIILIRRVSKIGAGLLLVSVLTLIIMTAGVWVFLADKQGDPDLAKGIAVELLGSIFVAVAIVLIEQAVERFTTDEKPPNN